MRLYCTLLILGLAASLFAQSKIVGFVKLQSSGNQALANAEVWAIGCASKPLRYSNAKGYFELEFPGKKAGDMVREITVTLEGYEVVNKKALENYGLLGLPDDNPLVIVLCKQGDYRKAAADYYQTIFNAGEAELQAEQRRLQALLEREQQSNELLQQQLAGINAKLENLPKVAEAAAEYFAKIDRDQATQLQQNALAELEKGNTQAALDAMPEDVMDQALANAQQRKQQLETQLAEVNQVIQQSIENYRFKAQLYVSVGDYGAAERLYEKAVLADTAHIENLYDYAVFLENIKYYDKALHWLQRVVHTTPDAWRIANAWSYMGQVYQETGDFVNAPLAYARSEALYDSLYQSAPSNDFYKNNLAISYSKLGAIHLALGQIDTALVYFQRRSKLGEELHAANPKSAQLWFGLGVSYYKLGALYAEIDSTGQAIGYYEQAAQVFKALYEATGLDSYWGNYQTVQRQLEKLMKPGGDLTRRLDRLEKQREAASSPAERVQYQKAIVELLQPLADADPGDETIGANLGGQYGSLAWYYLFNRQFAAAEQAARQGIALGGTETEWVHTNLALALLYQGEYEAAQAIYAAYKGKMFDKEDSWVKVFLADLDALEAEGITHPDVARVRAFLGE